MISIGWMRKPRRRKESGPSHCPPCPERATGPWPQNLYPSPLRHAASHAGASPVPKDVSRKEPWAAECPGLPAPGVLVIREQRIPYHWLYIDVNLMEAFHVVSLWTRPLTFLYFGLLPCRMGIMVAPADRLFRKVLGMHSCSVVIVALSSAAALAGSSSTGLPLWTSLDDCGDRNGL